MQNRLFHDPVFVQWIFRINLLFEPCLFWSPRTARHQVTRYRQAADRKVVLFQSVATSLRPSSAGGLSEPAVTIIHCSCFVYLELPLSGAFVHGQPSLFHYRSDQHQVLRLNERLLLCMICKYVEGAEGSSKILPLGIIVVLRGCNMFASLTKTSGMRRKWDERGIPNKCVVNKTRGSSSRLVFLAQVRSQCLCRWNASLQPIAKA